MDNHLLHYKGSGDVELRLAVALAFEHIPGRTVTGYRSEIGAFHLYWSHAQSEAIELPYALDGGGAFELIRGWLASRPESDYKEHPGDMDGSTYPEGFELTTEAPGGWSYRALEVSPIWTWHGK